MEWSLRISRDGEWLRHAWPSSTGLPNGPVFVYYVALFTYFSLSPLVANLGIVLANIAALAISVPLFRRLFLEEDDVRLAVALYATSPVAIWFSRKIWDPCLLPLFTVPALWIALKVFQDAGRPRLVLAIPPLLALAAMAHQSAIFFGIVLMATVLSAHRKIAWGALAAGVLVAIGLSYPYLSYVVPEVLLAPGGFTPTSASRYPDVDVLGNLLINATGHNILQSSARETGKMLLWPFPPVGLLIQLAAIPFFFYFFAGGAEAWRPRKPLPEGVRRLLVGLVAGLPALYLAMRVRGVAHYYLCLLPLLFALLVIGKRRILDSPRWRRASPRLTVLLGVNLLSWFWFQTYEKVHWGSESYGLPFGKLETACAQVAERARERGWGTEERPLVLIVDIRRDRGLVPHQYDYALERLENLRVRPPEEGEEPDLVLKIRWPHPGVLEEPPWKILEGPAAEAWEPEPKVA